MLTAFNFIIFLKFCNNYFQILIHSIFQYVAKFRLKCKKHKMDFYPELIDLVLFIKLTSTDVNVLFHFPAEHFLSNNYM